MKETVHAIFPLNFKKALFDNFAQNERYELIGFDTDIMNYEAFIMNPETITYAQNVFISVYNNNQIPFDELIKEIADIVVKVKLVRTDIRFILVFPAAVSENPIFKDSIGKLIMADIYDLHFIDEYNFADILDFLGYKQNKANLTHFIVGRDIPATIQSPINEPIHREVQQTQTTTPYQPSNEYEHQEITEEPVKESEKNNKISRIFGKKKEEKPNGKKRSNAQRERIIKPPVDSVTYAIQQGATQSVSHKKIAVIGLTKDVGTTFVTTTLASALTEWGLDVGIYENPVYEQHKTYLADMYMLFDEPTPRKDLVTSLINNETFDLNLAYKISNTTHYPVNYLNTPVYDFSLNDTLRYINTGNHTIKLMDMGCVNLKDLQTNILLDKLNLFDHVVFVLSPAPTKIIPNSEILVNFVQQLKLMGIENSIVLNKYESVVPLSDFKQYGIDNLVTITNVSPAIVLQALYNKKPIYNYLMQSGERGVLDMPFADIVSRIGIPITAEGQGKPNKSKVGIFGKKLAFAK